MSEHAHSQDASHELTRNLQALSDEEARLAQETDAIKLEKTAVVEAARQKAQALLEKAREKAEAEREKILAAEQARVDAEKDALLKSAEKESAALKKKKLNLTSKLLPLVFP